ncbi:MAG: thiamine-phosphate kinase [Chloroflexota bacterium]
MKLSRLGEFGLIRRIGRAMPAGRGVRIGIGDDAAWVNNPSGSSLISADLLIEDVHFNLKWVSLYDLGYKSLAVNLSDIAAMGGVAAYAVLSLGIPGDFDSQKIDEFYRGVKAVAQKYRVAIVGGDTNIANSLIVSICVIGHPPHQPIRRSGAKVGDDIYVTGTLGDSALGLKLLRQGKRRHNNQHFARLIARHHRPTPRLSTGALLARQRLAVAMIDVSDGLLQDLGHICEASSTGAVIFNDRLPLSRAYRALVGNDGTLHALSGGEDYELLFCARHKKRGNIEKLRRRTNLKITRIGTCVGADRGVRVVDRSGKPVSTPSVGHDHFKRRLAQSRDNR